MSTDPRHYYAKWHPMYFYEEYAHNADTYEFHSHEKDRKLYKEIMLSAAIRMLRRWEQEGLVP